MDANEMLNQLASNPKLAAQFTQLLQQNSMFPNPTMPNWNAPTNPMVAWWMNNLAGLMNNMMNNNQNNSQPPAQNQNPQQSNVQEKKTENSVSSVRVIKSPNEIKADEILMNGDISLFLQDDLGVVYGKRWTNNGTIENLNFVRVDDTVQNNSGTAGSSVSKLNIDVDMLMQNIANLVDGKLDQFRRDYSAERQKNVSKSGNSRKGVDENGE